MNSNLLIAGFIYIICTLIYTIANTGFIYKTKMGENGVVERSKARLVYKNHPIRFSVPRCTWDEVFSPVVGKTTLRIFLSFVAQRKFCTRQIEIANAFLNASLPKLCYFKLPMVCGDPPGLVCPMFKALYGHVEALNCGIRSGL